MIDFSKIDDGWSETPSRVAGEKNALSILGIRVEFCWIPPGEFWMGREDDDSRAWERPRHKVVLTRGFWMESTPVTQELWSAVEGANPSWYQGTANGFDGDPTLPVENVSWNGFQKFVGDLNALGAAPAGWRFSAPTEAQWEYACRAGTEGPRYGEPNEIAWHLYNSAIGKENLNPTPHPVGQKKPNAWGLCDALGNVWEWTADAFEKDFYERGPRTDPFCEGNPNSYRVYRGGNFRNEPAFCVAACRYWNKPNASENRYLGGRLALIPRD